MNLTSSDLDGQPQKSPKEKKLQSKKSMGGGNVILCVKPIFSLAKQKNIKDYASQSQQSDEDEDDEYDDNFALEAMKRKNDRGHRTISAEAYGIYNKKSSFKPKVVEKTNEQRQRIIQRLDKAFMFSALDEKEKNIVIDAMIEKQFKYH